MARGVKLSLLLNWDCDGDEKHPEWDVWRRPLFESGDPQEPLGFKSSLEA